MSQDSPRRVVVVTGASSGIGRACAQVLTQAGYRVIATVRAESDALPLHQMGLAPEDVLLLDVAVESSLDLFVHNFARRLNGDLLWGLVNNAGISVVGPVELITPGEWRQVFEVNVVGGITLTQKLLPWLRTSRGRIVNMSSLSGLISSPFMAAYSSSKFALEAVSDSLRLELRPSGIRVVLIEPGCIRTSIFDKALRQLNAKEAGSDPERVCHYSGMFQAARHVVKVSGRNGIDPRIVADAVLRAVQSSRPKIRYAVGHEAWPTRLLKHAIPDTLADWIIAFIYRVPKAR